MKCDSRSYPLSLLTYYVIIELSLAGRDCFNVIIFKMIMFSLRGRWQSSAGVMLAGPQVLFSHHVGSGLIMLYNKNALGHN